MLRFGAYFNYAAYLRAHGQGAKAQQMWDRAADHARAGGESLLFRAALTQLKATSEPARPLEHAPQVRSLRLGDRLTGAQTGPARAEFLLEGERYTLVRYADGAKFVLDAGNRVVHAWQDQGAVSLSKVIAVGDTADRPLKTLGMPSRYVVLTNGEYLAYDALGVAVRLHQGRVAGWFLYGTI